MSDTITARPAAPKITAAMIEAALRFPAGVIVQDDSGATYPLQTLTAAQADDPTICVVLPHEDVEGYFAATGKPGAAARLATEVLRSQHARGLL